MGVATCVAVAAVAAGVIAGSMSDHSHMQSASGLDLSPETARENFAKKTIDDQFNDLKKMVGAGPGVDDVGAGYNATKDFAALLEQYSRDGGLPNQTDINRSNDTAGKLFQGQRNALKDSFTDQQTIAARQAAAMGCTINDPVLAAKLGQEQMRQSAQLDANQGSFAQQMALAAPGARLGFTAQRAGVLGGLATQAMANRQQLAAMGEAIQNNETNFRLATATHWGKSDTESGGGVKGAITGGIAALGAVYGMGGMMGGGAGGGGAMGAGGGGMGAAAGAGSNYWSQPNPYSFGGSGFSNVGGGMANQYSLSGPAVYGGGRSSPYGFGYGNRSF